MSPPRGICGHHEKRLMNQGGWMRREMHFFCVGVTSLFEEKRGSRREKEGKEEKMKEKRIEDSV